MQGCLLFVIAITLLFGAGFVLGAFEIVLWIAVVATVIGAIYLLTKSFLTATSATIASLLKRPKAPNNLTNDSRVPDIEGVRFQSYQDYIDWANGEGRWKK
jgi:hypothetical protein